MDIDGTNLNWSLEELQFKKNSNYCLVCSLLLSVKLVKSSVVLGLDVNTWTEAWNNNNKGDDFFAVSSRGAIQRCCRVKIASEQMFHRANGDKQPEQGAQNKTWFYLWLG